MNVSARMRAIIISITSECQTLGTSCGLWSLSLGGEVQSGREWIQRERSGLCALSSRPHSASRALGIYSGKQCGVLLSARMKAAKQVSHALNPAQVGTICQT